MNPNNNQNFNDEALKINRILKKENDKLRSVIKELELFMLDCEISSAVEDREVGRLQQLIGAVLWDVEHVTNN